MIEVQLRETDRLDAALKLFKRKVQRAGILRELRRKRYYLKPSAARQLKQDTAERRRAASRRRALRRD